MNSLKLASRNLMRNRRRSLTTVLTMIIGVVALLLFGGFISSIYFGLQTSIVRSQGHIHIYPQGYLKYGSSRPADYYIDKYQEIILSLRQDKELENTIKVITPVVNLSGIAGNYAADTSKTFIAEGLIPSQRNKMQDWDQYRLDMEPSYVPLTDDNNEEAVVGIGLARMLNLCESLDIPDCEDRPVVANDDAQDSEILSLQLLTEEENISREGASNTQIDLLASTGSGAPNAVSLTIVEALRQANKVLDDSFVTMNLKQAQQLVFSSDSQVSAIIVQLNDSNFLHQTQVRLETLLSEIDTGQQFEVKNYTEFNAEFIQVINMFLVIFVFVTLVITLVVLFTTINTFAMSVMERISEIGSLRAMGVRRSTVRWQFLLEGAVVGMAGATLGVLVAVFLTQAFNHLGFNWTPPGNSESRSLQILLFANPILMMGSWLLMACVATCSTLMPAQFAAKMNIVSAIRNS